MKRVVSTGLLCAVMFLAGYITSPHTSVAAQPPQAAAEKPYTPLTMLEGKPMVWTAEDLKKMATSEKGTILSQGSLQAVTPIYRMNLWQRDYYQQAKMMDVSKTTSHWDDGEMHEDKTQIYIIISGTGTIVLGGHATNDHDTQGQHNGGPIVGGTNYKVKAGDWILIPPRTWHQVQPDPGQNVVYGMVHIQTETRNP